MFSWVRNSRGYPDRAETRHQRQQDRLRLPNIEASLPAWNFTDFARQRWQEPISKPGAQFPSPAACVMPITLPNQRSGELLLSSGLFLSDVRIDRTRKDSASLPESERNRCLASRARDLSRSPSPRSGHQHSANWAAEREPAPKSPRHRRSRRECGRRIATSRDAANFRFRLRDARRELATSRPL